MNRYGRIFVQRTALQAAIVLSAVAATGFSQTLNTSTLNGNYFVRHIEFTTNPNNTDARSILGTIAFNGRETIRSPASRSSAPAAWRPSTRAERTPSPRPASLP